MVRGPIKIPTGPNMEIPPSTENKIRSEGMLIFLLMMWDMHLTEALLCL